MPRRPRPDLDPDDLASVIAQLSADGLHRPSLADQCDLLAQLRQQSPASADAIERWMLGELASLREALQDADERVADVRRLHARLTSPPWFTAVFLRLTAGSPPLAAVIYQGAARVVTPVPELDLSALQPGDDVLLSHDLNLLVQVLTPSVTRACDVAEFQQALDRGRLLLRSRETEVVVQAAGSLDAAALQPGDRVRWDPTLGLAFERLPTPLAERFLVGEIPTESFDDVGGLDAEVRNLQRRLLLQFRHRDLMDRYRLDPLLSVLLVGPPGVGKTMVARALARWIGEISGDGRARFIPVAPGSLHSVWYSQTEANYRELFRAAEALGAADPGLPVVIFFDEIDSVAARRSSDSLSRIDDRVLNSFMTELNGFRARRNVLVVSATNRLDVLDPAMIRPGRLGDKIIHVPRPRMAGARAILERQFARGLPYATTGGAVDSRQEVIDTAVSRLFAPNGEGELATITFRDGTRRAVHAKDLVSGAMLAGITRQAAEWACDRERLGGDAGIRPADVIDAVSVALRGAVSALTPGNVQAHIQGLPQDLMVARIDLPAVRASRLHRFTAA